MTVFFQLKLQQIYGNACIENRLRDTSINLSCVKKSMRARIVNFNYIFYSQYLLSQISITINIFRRKTKLDLFLFLSPKYKHLYEKNNFCSNGYNTRATTNSSKLYRRFKVSVALFAKNVLCGTKVDH